MRKAEIVPKREREIPHDLMVLTLHDSWFNVIAIVDFAIIFAVAFLPCILILGKAGYSGWLLLLWLVPIADVVAL